MPGRAVRRQHRREDLEKRNPGGRTEFSIPLLSQSGFLLAGFSSRESTFCAILRNIPLAMWTQNLPDGCLAFRCHTKYGGDLFRGNARTSELNRLPHVLNVTSS